MEPRHQILRSRVAKRLLSLFIACALIPVGVLSALAYIEVSRELYRQSERRLQQASRSAGHAIFERLEELDSVLAGLDSAVAFASDSAALPEILDEYVNRLAVVDASGVSRALIGSFEAPPKLDLHQREHLNTGRALLVSRSSSDPDSAQTLLLRRLAPGKPELVVAALDPQRLSEDLRNGVLPPHAEFWLVDADANPLSSSSGAFPSLGDDEQQSLFATISGNVTFELDHEKYVGRHWSIFLEPRYGTRSWKIMLGEPSSSVLAPIARFRTLFPLVVLLCVLVALLLSVTQIRRRLAPLELLKEGTERLGAGEFGARVEVQSNDEFEDLGRSFNAMSDRLQAQFNSITTLMEVDRLVLSANTRPEVSSAVLARSRDLYPCDLVALILPVSEPESTFEIHASCGVGEMLEPFECPPIKPHDLAQLAAVQEYLAFDSPDRMPDYLAPIPGLGMSRCLVFPLVVRRVVEGILVLGHEDKTTGRDGDDAEPLVYVRQLVGQLAIALSSARTTEENRILAYYDSLTRLPNRLLFHERLRHSLQRARRTGDQLAVALLDLDGFKRVNDTLGHSIGDMLLERVAKRLSSIMRDGDVARLGGDEFTLLITDFDSANIPARILAKILTEVQRPYVLGDHEVFITASAGIAVYPGDGQDIETLMKNADAAMYHAKDFGRNNYQYYSQSMNTQALDRMRLETELRSALEGNEFLLYYQPVVDIQSREIVGVEALLRWQNPQRGLIPPTQFIPVAEETGMIVPIGEWVLREACRQVHQWHQQGHTQMRVAVNLSGRQFRDESLMASVNRTLEEFAYPAERLTLELTESIIMDTGDATLQILHQFRRMGIRLSIDDFGTGYSSLSYLKHFPLDHLKIDRSFIADLCRNGDDASITRAIIAMAHSLSLQVVAEGVENEEQFAFLAELGCDRVQGWLTGAAMSADDLEKLLHEDRPL